MTNRNEVDLSESIQMYLVSIARNQGHEKPVPLSLLAEILDISPVSVNEMCRKLQNRGLVNYRPYKGASLTDEGEQFANYILRRHRLWEVFLIEKLGFSIEEADQYACLLEHATPASLADRLDGYLESPGVTPEGKPIPASTGEFPVQPILPLDQVVPGLSVHVRKVECEPAAERFLAEQGIRPGVALRVLAIGAENLLIEVIGKMCLLRVVYQNR